MRLAGSHLGSAVYIAIMVAAGLVPATIYWAGTSSRGPVAHSMTPFTSVDELHQFILTKSCNSAEVRSLSNGASTPQPSSANGLSTTSAFSGSSSVSSDPSHSETNVQVSGVDELDTVKNDGTYIYTITNNTVAIVLAYPASDAKLLSRVSVNGSIQGIFVEGNRLVAISQQYQYYPHPIPYLGIAQPAAGSGIAYPSFSASGTSSIWIFDISNHSKPVLTTTLVMNGTVAGSRLIGNFVYAITTTPVYCGEPVPLPVNVVDGRAVMMLPSQIYHTDIADHVYSFTTVVAIDITQPNPAPTADTFLIGTSSNIYVSTNQIYLTQPIWNENEETAIHRIDIQGSKISYEATGTVLGHVLNQFSMDESNGFFRVATTNTGFAPVVGLVGQTYFGSRQQTNLYVLDGSLHIVGKLEGLSPGEAFYSARFMGDRAYLVTYQRMDPLFVIGLRDPSHPTVLGQLNITGVSDYLQPYDENHLIGLGKSSTNVTWENSALFQGLKLSLFDVTDPNHPIDTSNFLVGDRGSESPALTDHRAVLFDRSLNLLVIPLQIAQSQTNTTYPWGYNPIVWQGAYVFNVTINGGLVFRGGITQLPAGQLPSYTNSNLYVTRALYIGSVLYTISGGMIKMNNLTDLSAVGSVPLE